MAKLLVVDDEMFFREMLSDILVEQGHSVTTADCGTRALEALKAEDFSAVLLDIIMPDLSGIEVLEQMRQFNPTLPAIMITAERSLDTVKLALKRGAYDYINKPFAPEEVLHSVQRAVEKHSLDTAVRQLLQDLQHILTISQQTNALLEVRQVLKFIVESAALMVPAQICSLVLANPDEGVFNLSVFHSKKTTFYPLHMPINQLDSEIYEALFTRKDNFYSPQINLERIPSAFLPKDSRIKSFLATPLVFGDKVIALLNLGHAEAGIYNENHKRIIAILAGQTATAVVNAQLFQKMKNFSQELERQVKGRTQELEAAHQRIQGFNKELEAQVQKATQALEKAYLELDEREKTLNKRMLELVAVKEVGQAISSIFDLDLVLELVLNLCMAELKAEVGSVMLVDEKTRQLKICLAHGLDKKIMEETHLKMGESIAGYVAQTGKPLLVSDIEQESKFARKSQEKYKTKSLVSVPLKVKNKVLGVININNKVSGEPFDKNDLNLLTTLATQAAVALENATLFEKLQQEEKLKGVYERYLSATVVEKIVQEGREIHLGGVREKITVIFADIRGFTPLAERLDPEEVVTILNEYLTSMSEVVFRYDGTLDKYIGDGLMAVFGAPFSHPDDPQRAVKAAVEMLVELQHLEKKRSKEGKLFLNMGIGISTGPAIAGNIGSMRRMDYTVVGDTVNLAARLESIAQGGQILISRATYEEVKELVDVNELPPMRIKGKEAPVAVYEVVRIKG